jgi:hypothetical protein
VIEMIFKDRHSALRPQLRPHGEAM